MGPEVAREPAGLVGSGGGTSRSATRRRRRRLAAAAAAVAANGLPSLPGGSGAQILELGDSVLVGDLSELFGGVEVVRPVATEAVGQLPAHAAGHGPGMGGGTAPSQIANMSLEQVRAELDDLFDAGGSHGPVAKKRLEALFEAEERLL